MSKPMTFHQLYESETGTYTYLLADPETKEAVLIDPVLEKVERDLTLVQEYGYRLKYVLDTHIHADHITGAGEIRKRTGAQSVVSEKAHVDCVDIKITDGQELHFGRYTLKALETPGHTDSCMSYYIDGKIFTGDALLIRGTGRTDFQQGSSAKLYDSITGKLFALPDDTVVYPGHDYRGQTTSSIEMEKKYNPRIGGGKTKEQFVQIMSELKLAQPKKIHEAVPANLSCGILKPSDHLQPNIVDGIPEVLPAQVLEHLQKVEVIDVRRSEEFTGELGHIQGAKLVTLGKDLENFLGTIDRNADLVFVCRSGGRSGEATRLSQQLGFKNTMNMKGGMLAWNEQKLPTVRF
ncbi:MAG: MBL fold metallo-hydrolase [Bdellovibrionales bacterium]|nr:MBL fold metallo-hydrolase [Bdellovibrionales bacterium]